MGRTNTVSDGGGDSVYSLDWLSFYDVDVVVVVVVVVVTWLFLDDNRRRPINERESKEISSSQKLNRFVEWEPNQLVGFVIELWPPVKRLLDESLDKLLSIDAGPLRSDAPLLGFNYV